LGLPKEKNLNLIDRGSSRERLIRFHPALNWRGKEGYLSVKEEMFIFSYTIKSIKGRGGLVSGKKLGSSSKIQNTE